LFRAFVGGIGSGKSWAGAYDVIKRAKPGRLYLVVAPTYSMLSDATFRSFLSLAEELGIVEPSEVKRSAPPSIRLRTGAEVLFRSADEPDRLRGPNLSGVWMDEASLMIEDVFTVAIGRLREGGEQGWLSATFTPKGKTHWTYETFATGKPNTAIFHARTADNPFLPAGFHGTVLGQYTSTLAAQELEGAFIDVEGTLFRRGWFLVVEASAVPYRCRRARYWDRAATEGGGDWTVGVLLAAADGTYFVEDVVRGQWSVGQRDRIMRQTAERDNLRYNRSVKTWVEQEPGSGGKEAALAAVKLLAGFTVRTDKVTRSKEHRAEPFAAQAEHGNVRIVRGSWNSAFLDELCSFPDGAFDDQVDAVAGAFAKLGVSRPSPIAQTRILSIRGPRKPGVQGLRIVLASRDELPALQIDDVPCLLVSITDPPGAALPEHRLSKLLDSLVLTFADIDPAELQGRWDAPLQPHGVEPEQLLMTRDQGKQLWRFLVRRRDPAPGALVLVDDGGADRRAESVARGLAAMLREPPATIHKASDLEWRPGEGSAPNPYLFRMARDSAGLVVC
jgi:predicted phage terminase large subunit-like protein